MCRVSGVRLKCFNFADLDVKIQNIEESAAQHLGSCLCNKEYNSKSQWSHKPVFLIPNVTLLRIIRGNL